LKASRILLSPARVSGRGRLTRIERNTLNPGRRNQKPVQTHRTASVPIDSVGVKDVPLVYVNPTVFPEVVVSLPEQTYDEEELNAALPLNVTAVPTVPVPDTTCPFP
jgi:hypothetical protein